MLSISKRYVVDENDNKVAVEIDIGTFEKMEEIIENHGLWKLMKESENSPALTLDEAKSYYDNLEKIV